MSRSAIAHLERKQFQVKQIGYLITLADDFLKSTLEHDDKPGLSSYLVYQLLSIAPLGLDLLEGLCRSKRGRILLQDAFSNFYYSLIDPSKFFYRWQCKLRLGET